MGGARSVGWELLEGMCRSVASATAGKKAEEQWAALGESLEVVRLGLPEERRPPLSTVRCLLLRYVLQAGGKEFSFGALCAESAAQTEDKERRKAEKGTAEIGAKGGTAKGGKAKGGKAKGGGAASEGAEGAEGADGGWPMQSVEETILEVAREYFNSAMSMTGDGVGAAEQTVAILLDVRPDSTCAPYMKE